MLTMSHAEKLGKLYVDERIKPMAVEEERHLAHFLLSYSPWFTSRPCSLFFPLLPFSSKLVLSPVAVIILVTRIINSLRLVPTMSGALVLD